MVIVVSAGICPRNPVHEEFPNSKFRVNLDINAISTTMVRFYKQAGIQFFAYSLDYLLDKPLNRISLPAGWDFHAKIYERSAFIDVFPVDIYH